MEHFSKNFKNTVVGVESDGFLLDFNTLKQLGKAAENLDGFAVIYSFGDPSKILVQSGRVSFIIDDRYFICASIMKRRFGQIWCRQ